MPQSYFYQRANFVGFLASSLQIGLFSTYPANNGLGLELTSANAPGYSRRPIALTPILNMCASNTAAITWAATGDWTATAYYFGIFLASSGSLVYWGALPSFLVARSGGVPKIAAGSLLVDWTNPATGLPAVGGLSGRSATWTLRGPASRFALWRGPPISWPRSSRPRSATHMPQTSEF